MLSDLQKETKSLKNPQKIESFKWFFKTGKGEYGEGDQFYGLTVPICRSIAKKYRELSLVELQRLIKSKIHEERLIVLLILTEKFKKADDLLKEKVFNFYLKNTKYINNWDLVDLSAHKIVGAYLLDKNIKILVKLAHSNDLWEKRISIISTFAFINSGSSTETLKIAEILLYDKHDLIHKAVGWLLREVGKRVSMKDETEFLDKYASSMPRTMLRYAIERFPEKLRNEYMQIKQKTASSH